MTEKISTVMAQAAPTGRIILLIGLAIVAVILFGLIALTLRRRLFGDAVEQGEAFDMESLQRQRRAGLISEEEFRSLRRALLGLPPENPPPGEPSSDSSESESQNRPPDV